MTSAPVVRIQRIMPAPPDVVYEQWLDPESLRDWMCPDPVRVVDVRVEPRVGGIVRFDVDDSGRRVLITGQFLELVDDRRLRFTWSGSDWPDPTAVSIVEVTFEPTGVQETLMTIEHSLLPSQEWDGHRAGWTATADQLAARIASATS